MYSNDMVMLKSGEKRCDEVMYSNDMVMSKSAEKRGDEVMHSNDMVMSKAAEKRGDEVMHSNDMVMSKSAEKRGDEVMYSNDMVMSKSAEKRGGAESSVRMSQLHPKVTVSFRIGSDEGLAGGNGELRAGGFIQEVPLPGERFPRLPAEGRSQDSPQGGGLCRRGTACCRWGAGCRRRGAECCRRGAGCCKWGAGCCRWRAEHCVGKARRPEPREVHGAQHFDLQQRSSDMRMPQKMKMTR